ncbi:MAG TPA: class I SAM-dependent methyltransferase [Jatrophihabitans sp.]|jgi:ubiquinone/menaquinone biosynthesis C-methylase UbiE|uniref:class I SAM-dependent methyltransferase n=1 Tax=Jatrophihabitans sp. TaxID=1932789 RepID=UPI002EF878EA
MTGGQQDDQRLPDSVLARSFGSEAARYDQVRPSYPAAAIELLLAGLRAGPGEGRVPRVLDLGAGTGKLTAVLLDARAEVVAVEPDRQMLAVLAARLPQANALAGSAEGIPLRDGSVDAIMVGQAFHWFQRPEADRELARVLRPGGVVGLLWNVPDHSVEWVSKLYWASRKRELARAQQFDQLDGELFTEPEQASMPSEHLLPGPQGLRDLVHTWSWVITRSKAEQDAIDHRIRILTSQYAELQAPVVAFPQRTEVLWQYRR